MKKILFVLLAMLFATQISFADSQNLNFILSIDEDYGIQIPENATKLDRFVFEYINDGGSSELVSGSDFSVGSLQMNENSTVMTLLYYGNLSNDYDVILSGDMGDGWNLTEDDTIPVNVAFAEASNKPEDIRVTELEGGDVGISVPATAARNSVPVVDLILSWEGLAGHLPGEYAANLKLELTAV